MYLLQAASVQSMHEVLANLYNEMMPLCSKLIGVSQLIAAFGALLFIAYRVWKHIANAEPIDFFPLFKPFVLAIVIGLYPKVLATFNGLLKPMVTSTGAMVKNSNEAVEKMLAARAKSITTGEEWQTLMGGLGYEDDNKDWYKYQNPEEPEHKSGGLSFGKAIAFSFSLITNTLGFIIKGILSAFLQVLYYAAALCIDTMRTFHLLILGILGPFVLCLSMFDGFQHTLPVWLGRYINIYLWLPISNLFGALIGRIQEGMLQLDISQSAQGDLIGFGPTDMAYLIFLVIAIIGYFSIPSIANYVVHASGASTILSKTNTLIMGGASMVTGGSIGSSGGGMSSDIMGADKKMFNMADAANSEPYFKDGGSNYQRNQLSGS
jgi:conjugative transposon TraJ protein